MKRIMRKQAIFHMRKQSSDQLFGIKLTLGRGYKTQLSMEFKMLINIEIAKIDGIFKFNSLEPVMYPANKF